MEVFNGIYTNDDADSIGINGCIYFHISSTIKMFTKLKITNFFLFARFTYRTSSPEILLF